MAKRLEIYEFNDGQICIADKAAGRAYTGLEHSNPGTALADCRGFGVDYAVGDEGTYPMAEVIDVRPKPALIAIYEDGELTTYDKPGVAGERYLGTGA